MSETQLADHRERVIDQLSARFAGDDLEVDELERRIALAHAADTPTALDALVSDLAPAAAPAHALVPAHRIRVVLGSTERAGRWTVPSQLATRVVWGNLRLDLREAQLALGVTTIDVHVTMGHVEIVVPPEIAVELDASPLLGNVEDRVELATTTPTRIVRITGRVALGNLEVWTLRHGETERDARRRRRWERRARRRAMRAAYRYGLPAPRDW